MKLTLAALGFSAMLWSCAAQHSRIVTLGDDGVEGSLRLLVVLSGSNYVTTVEGVKHPTGYFLSELAGPAMALQRSGHELVYATPNGNPAAMDKVSDDSKWFKTPEAYAEARRFVATTTALMQPLDLASLSESDLQEFSGVLIPGGHAPLEDLASSADVARILRHFHREGKPTALICHGPAALLSAQADDGWLYSGYRMTAFSTAEEKQEEDAGHLDGHMPYYLDAELRRLGAMVEVASPWGSKAIRDRELITAQNPMSEEEFVGLLMEAMVEKRLAGIMPERLTPGQVLQEATLYTVGETSFNTADWNSGYRTLWVGYRSGVDRGFLAQLSPHVSLTLNSLQDKGLKGYVVYATVDYEIAFLRWDTKRAAEEAFASPGGQAVVADAGQFMKAVVFKEIDKNPFVNQVTEKE